MKSTEQLTTEGFSVQCLSYKWFREKNNIYKGH